MVKEDKQNNGFIKNLIRQGGIEKAPVGFADKVMTAIDAENIPVGEGRWSWNGWWLWASIVFAFIWLVIAVFWIDFSFMGSVFEGIELDGSRMTQFFSNLGNGLVGLYEGFNISSLSITIAVAIGALFLIDRLLRRKPDMEIPII
ncbi:MAG: hypothetical protein KAT76_04015 [Bacteroidales bacterium]|nr:hypothetical protein [Bacteroidales bacterium]